MVKLNNLSLLPKDHFCPLLFHAQALQINQVVLTNSQC